MEKNIFNLNDKIYSNHNILHEIVSVLQQLMNYSKDNLIIKKLGKIINKMNYIIIENKKNLDLIRDDINKILNQMNDKNSVLKFNDIMNNKELKYNNGRYVGQIVNGKREGKGIYYWNGERYEGDWKNDKREGKGIYYYKNGDREMGDWKYGKGTGKHVKLCENGEVKTINY